MTEARQAFLQQLAEDITALHSGHTVRVAIDGVDTAGKTTLANELVKPIEALGRPVIRASLDGFHKPRESRYKRGKDSPEGFYYDSFNYDALIDKLLKPLGESESAEYTSRVFDFITDTPVNETSKQPKPGSVLLFDGVFLLRPELNPFWDFKIFIHIDFAEELKRAVIRDRKYMGDEVEEKYKTRYIPGQKLYLRTVQPQRLANIVIDNADVNDPFLVIEQ